MSDFSVWVRLTKFKSKGKRCEAGQDGEVGDHYIGWDVPGMRNTPE